MNFRKSFIVLCIMVASASLYYMHATDSKVQESSYAQFAASYTSLFKEAPSKIWANKPSCSVESSVSCSGCAAM